MIQILFHKQIFLNAYWLFQVYADYVTISGGIVHTTKENAKALVVARKEIGLEVNVDTTKNMVMSGYQNAGRSHNTY